MCGIIGFLDKRTGPDRPVGRVLLNMLQALSCRGPDSAGVAVFLDPAGWRLRVSVPPGPDADTAIAALRTCGVAVHRDYGNGVFDGMLATEPDIAALEDRIREKLPGAEVICL